MTIFASHEKEDFVSLLWNVLCKVHRTLASLLLHGANDSITTGMRTWTMRGMHPFGL
jgi:hypothetical protein